MTTESPTPPGPAWPVPGHVALQCDGCHRIIGIGESLNVLSGCVDAECGQEHLRSAGRCTGALRLVAVATIALSPIPAGAAAGPFGEPAVDTTAWPVWAREALAGYDGELARLQAAGADRDEVRSWRARRAELLSAMKNPQAVR